MPYPFVKYGADIWQNFRNSVAHKPIKDEIRQWCATVEAALPITLAAFGGNLQNALLSGAPIIDGNGMNVTLTSTINITNPVQLRNMTIITNGLAAGQKVFDIKGTEGTYTALTSAIAANTFFIPVASATGFAVGDYIFLRSQKVWSPAAIDDVKCGEIHRISGISGNVLTIDGWTITGYDPVNTAEVCKLNLLEGIIFENVHFKNTGGASNMAVRAYLCLSPLFINSRASGFQNCHIDFDRTEGGIVLGGGARDTQTQVGLNYGVVSSFGSRNILVDGYKFDNGRHGATVGGSWGICDDINITNCSFRGITDGGIDSHSAANRIKFHNNYCKFSNYNDGEKDGGVVQCAKPTVTNNVFEGVSRHGIGWDLELQVSDVRCEGLFAGNIFKKQANAPVQGTGTSNGVTVSTSTSNVISSLIIQGNRGDGFTYGFNIATTTAGCGAIQGVVCEGNQFTNCSIRGSLIYAKYAPIEVVSFKNNDFESFGAYENIYFQGSAGFLVNVLNESGNTTRGAYQTARRFYFCDTVFSYGNNATGYTAEMAVAFCNNVYIEGSFPNGADYVPSLTLAAGVLTVPNTRIKNAIVRTSVAGVSGTPVAETMTSIVGLALHQKLQLHSGNSYETITISEAGNVRFTGTTRVLDNTGDLIEVQNISGTAFETSYANNNT